MSSKVLTRAIYNVRRYISHIPWQNAVALFELGHLLWLHGQELSFTLKSLAERLMFISAVYACPLSEQGHSKLFKGGVAKSCGRKHAANRRVWGDASPGKNFKTLRNHF